MSIENNERSFDLNPNQRIESPDEILKAVQVAKTTAESMEGFFNPDGDRTTAIGEFKQETLPFLNQAERGLLFYSQTFDNLTNPTNEEVAHIITRTHGVTEEVTFQDRMMFGFMSLTLSAIPEVIDIKKGEEADKIRGLLHAPRSFADYTNRIREMKKEIHKMINGVYDFSAKKYFNPGLMRTYWFFNVGKEISSFYNNKSKLLQQYINETTEQFSDGISLYISPEGYTLPNDDPHARERYDKTAKRLLDF